MEALWAGIARAGGVELPAGKTIFGQQAVSLPRETGSGVTRRTALGLIRALRKAAHAIANRVDYARTVQVLEGLDDRMLADVGIARSDIREVSRQLVDGTYPYPERFGAVRIRRPSNDDRPVRRPRKAA